MNIVGPRQCRSQFFLKVMLQQVTMKYILNRLNALGVLAELREGRHAAGPVHGGDGLAHEPVLARRLDHGRPLVPHGPGQVQRVHRLVRIALRI